MLLSICASRVAAQDASNPLGGDIRASSTNCSVSSSCVWQKLPANATSLTVTVANGPVGSFTGTLQFEQSSNGGFNFSAASPASTTVPGVFTFTVTSFTDFRVRASAFASGDASVNIQASGPATGPPGPAGPVGGSSVSPNSPSPVNLYNVKNYGAVGDAKKAFRAVTANGNAHITDTLDFNPWVAGDVGKKIFCTMNGGANVGQNPLNVTIATITAFNSATDITVNTTGNAVAAASTECVWYTQDDGPAFLAAGIAAGTTIATAAFKGFSEYTAIGTVYCPAGGYVVSGPVLDQQGGNPYTLGVNFAGEGRSACRIYPTPNVTATHNGIIMSLVQTGGQRISGFSVDCGFAIYSIVGAAGFNFSAVQHMIMSDIEVDSCGNTSGSTPGMFAISGTNVIMDGLTVNGTSLGSSTAAFAITGTVIHMRNINTTNPGQIPLQISSSGGTTGGARTSTSAGVIVENSVFDEGGATGAIRITTNSSVNFIGVTALAGASTVMSVDGTSSVYVTDSNFTSFGGTCSGGNRQALTLASGAFVYATFSDFAGCGANGAGLSAAVSGPAGATFVSAGGNTFRNCPGGPPCPLVTAAQYPTLAFNGGVVPKSSETHTPNTCNLTITPITNATTFTLCNNFMDQNYQLLKITASSQVTTTCATAPIVTISDGVNSATLTLTSAANTWASAALSTVFASGNTMTVKYDVAAASACATPPTNLAVSFVLQSVLNP